MALTCHLLHPTLAASGLQSGGAGPVRLAWPRPLLALPPLYIKVGRPRPHSPFAARAEHSRT